MNSKMLSGEDLSPSNGNGFNRRRNFPGMADSTAATTAGMETGDCSDVMDSRVTHSTIYVSHRLTVTELFNGFGSLGE